MKKESTKVAKTAVYASLLKSIEEEGDLNELEG